MALRHESPAGDGKIGQVILDFERPGCDDWFVDGFAFGLRPVRPGDAILSARADRPIAEVVRFAAAQSDPAWHGMRPAPNNEIDHGRLGKWERSGRTLRTRTVTLGEGRLWYLVRGSGRAYAAVDSHLVVDGPLHGRVLLEWNGTRKQWQWIEHDLTPYAGHRVHVEFSPSSVAEPLAIARVVEASSSPPVPFEHPPETPVAATDALRALVEERAALVGDIMNESHTALAMFEGNGVDARLLIRGVAKTPGPVLPRRFLEAVGGASAEGYGPGSGRLQLARQIVAETNPLTRRVIVNRIWQHLFGRGIVATVDNFGVLGRRPSNPELLDWLALKFSDDYRWSIKRLIKTLVLSSTYQMSSVPDAKSAILDPENLLLQHMPIRRLEAEAIRDALLAVSGRLDRTVLGPPVEVHLTAFMDGRGRPAGGPLDGRGRRSIYIKVRRNFLAPMMLAFDAPIPFTTFGARSSSNVPAQALILMNDPFVQDLARIWATREMSKSSSPNERVQSMYLSAFARPAAPDEVRAALEFVGSQIQNLGPTSENRRADEQAWSDLAHVLFNAKEFIFVR